MYAFPPISGRLFTVLITIYSLTMTHFFAIYKHVDTFDPMNSERVGMLLGSKVYQNVLDCVEHANSHSVFFDNAVTNRDIVFSCVSSIGYPKRESCRNCTLKSSKGLEKQDEVHLTTGIIVMERCLSSGGTTTNASLLVLILIPSTLLQQSQVHSTKDGHIIAPGSSDLHLACERRRSPLLDGRKSCG
jgi:hypothetical protein